MTTVRTTCPYCGVGCGVLAETRGGAVTIRGDPSHPANRGALCSKGAALHETLGLEQRLLSPQVGRFEVPWEAALDTVATRFLDTIKEHGPDSVAFYVSGQLLTEDYYVANKLMKGFIGSANIDTNSRLCMSSAVAAHRRAFGEDLVPVGYEDLDHAELVVLVGSNLAWCHPVLYQRLIRAKAERPTLRLVVIDPRRTPTCEAADLHLPVRSGTDVMLFNGLLAWMAQQGCLDERFLNEHTQGGLEAIAAAKDTAGDPASVASHCGLDFASMLRFFEWFRDQERCITVFSQGVNQSSSGTDKANAIINMHLATGRIGKPGMGPLSITGQPNAMGGREVGGLATSLAAHMDLENPKHRALVQSFWRAPQMADKAGLKAVDLFEAILSGRIKALWIMATNPIVSMPNANRARKALESCEFLVVSDVVRDTDTLKLAHVKLPALAWGEKCGTVTNSDRTISRQRAFLPPPGEARADWWMVCQVAARMGFADAFGYDGPAEIFDEHARLSGLDNDGARVFDIGALSGLSSDEYQTLEPIQWPRSKTRSCDPTRLFTDARFSHADGRARLIPLKPQPARFEQDAEYPLIMNTGRIRDHWHTMTRTAKSARLSAHLSEPFVDCHAADALAFGLKVGGLARLTTRWGQMVVRVRTSGEMARGSVFVPIHWNGSNSSDARVGALVNPSVDPLSGEPEFKHTPVRIESFVVSWHGLLLSREGCLPRSLSWWTEVNGGDHRRLEMAGREVPRSWPAWARAAVSAPDDGDFVDYLDVSTGTYRAAYLTDSRLEACLYISPRPELPSRSWAASWFSKTRITGTDRHAILSGRSATAAADPGELVCSCFRVGKRALEAAIASGCRDVKSIGARLKAGSNCGSCISEIRGLLNTAEALPG